MSYIYLDRKIQEHWLWSDKPYDKARAWIDLLMLADFRDRQTLHKGKVHNRKRGEVYVSLLWLADRWGWSRNKVRRFIKLLEEHGMVKLNATRNDTSITIENYCKYQDKRTTDETTDETTDDTSTNQVRNKHDTSTNHIKERERKGKKGQVRESKVFVAPTVAEVEDYCFERQNGIDAGYFVDYYGRQGWRLSNGQPVKDWKACVRTWERGDNKHSSGGTSFLDL